MKWRLEDRRV